jgi:hypothetical protein
MGTVSVFYIHAIEDIENEFISVESSVDAIGLRPVLFISRMNYPITLPLFSTCISAKNLSI